MRDEQRATKSADPTSVRCGSGGRTGPRSRPAPTDATQTVSTPPANQAQYRRKPAARRSVRAVADRYVWSWMNSDPRSRNHSG